jgi:hypothetical protein
VAAQSDQLIGQIALSLAYDFMGLPRDRILRDDDAARVAATTAHQISLLLTFKGQLPENRWLEISPAELSNNVDEHTHRLARFCGTYPVPRIVRSGAKKN